MAIHRLKTWPAFYEAIEKEIKTFEIRYNDRNFKVGDVLILEKYNPDLKRYEGAELLRTVSYMTDWNQKPGFVVMAIQA